MPRGARSRDRLERAVYSYRADGMRVSRFYNSALTRYRYDGQMGVEDVEYTTGGAVSAVTRYGLGARGVDLMERTAGSTVTTGFPLYDAHGNMVATLSRSGTNGYAVNDRRGYSAWGDIRTGGQTGDPKGRYCANLGHRADDEGGYVYMRARYYQPTEGRFLSEDPATHGWNWYAYAANNPIDHIDANGQWEALAGLGNLIVGLLLYAGEYLATGSGHFLFEQVAAFVLGGFGGLNKAVGTFAFEAVRDCLTNWQALLSTQAVEYSEKSLAAPAVQAEEQHIGEIQAELLLQTIDESIDLGGYAFRYIVR